MAKKRKTRKKRERLGFELVIGTLAVVVLTMIFFGLFGMTAFEPSLVTTYTKVFFDEENNNLVYQSPQDTSRSPLPESFEVRQFYKDPRGGIGAWGPSFEGGEDSLNVIKWYLTNNDVDIRKLNFNFDRNRGVILISLVDGFTYNLGEINTVMPRVNEQLGVNAEAIGLRLWFTNGCETGTNTNIYVPCMTIGFNKEIMEFFSEQMYCEASGTISGVNSVNNNDFTDVEIDYSLIGEVSYLDNDNGLECRLLESAIMDVEASNYWRFSGVVNFIMGEPPTPPQPSPPIIEDVEVVEEVVVDDDVIDEESEGVTGEVVVDVDDATKNATKTILVILVGILVVLGLSLLILLISRVIKKKKRRRRR